MLHDGGQGEGVRRVLRCGRQGMPVARLAIADRCYLIFKFNPSITERKEALDRCGGHVGEIVQAEVRAADS